MGTLAAHIQTWKVRVVSPTEAQLLYDPQRIIPDTDPTALFTWIGMGAFVEALDIAARAHGHEVVASLDFPVFDRHAPGPVAVGTLELRPTSKASAYDPALVLQRRTSRIAYDGKPVDPALLERCAALARACGHTLHWSTEPGLVDFVLRLNQETLFLDLDDPLTRDEIGLWIRTTRREAQTKRDGLWNVCMGFPGWLFRLFFRHRRLLEMPVLKQVLRGYYLRSARGTRTVAWLSGPWETCADGYAAGRMLLRVWLELTRAGVGLHPFGSTITNVHANARLQARLGDTGPGTLWFIVRLGGTAPPPRSLRLEARELVVA